MAANTTTQSGWGFEEEPGSTNGAGATPGAAGGATAGGGDGDMQEELTMELNMERGVLIYVADPTLTAPTDELLAEKTRNKKIMKKTLLPKPTISTIRSDKSLTLVIF